MPRDLFGDVTRPSISVGTRKWYAVPVSLVSHSAIVAVLVALPILAPALMPEVFTSGIDAPRLIDIIPPAPPPQPRLRPREPIADPQAFPVNAPDSIEPEREIDLSFQDAAGPGVVGGVDQFSDVLAEPIVPAAPEQQAPLPVGGAIRTPTKVRDVKPVYPPMAQAARIEGIVIIEATIDVDGRIMNARVLRSVPMLDPAALDAVRQWQFTPTLLNGVPVPVIMTVTVAFKLQ